MDRPTKKSKVQGGGWASNTNPRAPQYASKPKPNPTKTECSEPRYQFGHLVVHVKNSPYDVYIGRPNPKVPTCDCRWGNPFKIPQDGQRAEVIAKYKNWLTTTDEGLKILAQAKTELPGKVLACWCAPLACHGNVLAELVNQKTEITLVSPSLSVEPIKVPDNYELLFDGCVLIRNAFNLAEQQFMVDEILKYARGQIPDFGSFFAKKETGVTQEEGYTDPIPANSDPTSGILNLQTKARVNVPFSIVDCPKDTVKIWEMCSAILTIARVLSPSIPDLNPNVWRLNYYRSKGKIGWHFDRHPRVDMKLQHTVKQPVFSVSIGDAGDFDYKPLVPTFGVSPDQDYKTIRLNSGDVIIFGGPARQLMHRVPKIYFKTSPPGLHLHELQGRFNFGFYEN